MIGWIARDETGELRVHFETPERDYWGAGYWSSGDNGYRIDDNLSDVNWLDEPVEVEVMFNFREVAE